MLMIILCPFLGIFIGKYIRNVFALAFASLIFTGVSSAIVNAIMHEMGTIDDKQAAKAMVVGGLLFYPIITLISALLTRRAVLKKAKQSPKPSPKPKSQAKVMIPSSRDYISSDDEEQAWSEAHNEFTNDRREGLWIKCLYSCEQNEYEAQKLYVETRVEELLSIVENQRISVAKKAKAIRQTQLREQEREVRRGNWKAFIITVVIFVLIFVLLAAIERYGFLGIPNIGEDVNFDDCSTLLLE
jgi:uncharacterized membrane protein